MPTINLTNNADLNLDVSAPGADATLNRYLTSALKFQMPPAFDAFAAAQVKDQKDDAFPVTLGVVGEGKFALEKTCLTVQAGASGAIGLVKEGKSDFLSDLELPGDPTCSGIVSFEIEGTLSAAESVEEGDFAFGIAAHSRVGVKSYRVAATGETVLHAVGEAAKALTIPHDLQDLESIPAGAICRIEASSSLRFTASATYSFVNDPLAAVAIEKLPGLEIQAGASATLEGEVTHSSDHVLTIAKLPDGRLHLAVDLKRTDDFETSLTVSSGIGASIADQDPLAFLLDKINPSAKAEADVIAGQMKDAAGFKGEIKSAIDNALCTSLGASLKAALDASKTRNRAFLYEIDLAALDGSGRSALESALAGDFRAITKSGPPLNGIRQLASALTVTKEDQRTFTFHLLGIFNASSIHDFVCRSKISFTDNTHELVLSDERLQVVTNNLASEKLREIVLKDITLTIPASANTKEADTPVTLAYLDREGSASPAKMRQFVNVLRHIEASQSAAAAALLDQKRKHYGTCGMFLGLKLHPGECRRLFLGADGKPFDWLHYVSAMCAAEQVIYSGLDDDPENVYHLKVFRASQSTWKELRDAGAVSNKIRVLKGLGMTDTEAQLASADVVTAIWWSNAMANYATALARAASLEVVGKEVVKDSNAGYKEPWMILTAWDLAGRLAITADFSCSLAAVSAAGN